MAMNEVTQLTLIATMKRGPADSGYLVYEISKIRLVGYSIRVGAGIGDSYM